MPVEFDDSDLLGIPKYGDDYAPQRQAAGVSKSLADNPESFAETLAISDKTGFPVDMVERNKTDIINNQKQPVDIEDQLLLAPEAANWAKDPNNLALVSDDPSFFGGVKKTFGSAATEFEKGVERNKLIELRSKQFMGNATPAEIAEAEALSKSTSGLSEGTGGFWSEALITASSAIPQMYETTKEGVKGAAVGGGTALALGQLPGLNLLPEELITVPTAVRTGFVGGFGIESFKQNTALAYDSILSIRDEQGNAIDPMAAKGASALVGAISAPLDVFGFGKLLDTVPGMKALKGRLTRDTVKKVLLDKGVSTALGNIGKRYAEAVATEGVVGSLQELAQITGEELSKNLSEGQFKDISAGEAINRIIESGKQEASAALIIGGAGSAASVPFELRKKGTATPEQVKAQVEAINEGVKSSKLYQRSPERFHALVRDLAGDEKLYVNAEAMQGAVLALPEEQQQQLFAAIPDLKTEIQTSALTNADIAISKADYISYIAPFPQADLIKDYIKIDPADMSVAERTQYQQMLVENPEIANELQQQASVASQAAPEEMYNAAERAIRKAMADAGITPREISTSAPLFARTIARFAAPLGSDAITELGRSPLEFQTIKNGEIAGSGSTLDVLLKDLKKVYEGKKVAGLDEKTTATLEQLSAGLRDSGVDIEQLSGMNVPQIINTIFPNAKKAAEVGNVGETNYAVAPDLVENVTKILEQYTPESIGDTIDVDGVSRPVTNSEGRYIARDAESLRNFWRWFGDSKVVDAEGRPLVVYHGTGSDIEEFDFRFANQGNDQLGSGFYFSTSATEAGGYANSTMINVDRKPGGKSPNVIPAYLSIKNPLDAGFIGNITNDQVEELINRAPDKEDALTNWDENPNVAMRSAIEAYTVNNDNVLGGIHRIANDFYGDNIEALDNALRDVLGYDGVVAKSDELTHWVAWFPEQIKSVHNIGDFSVYNPKILQQDALGSARFITMQDGLKAVIISLSERRNMSTLVHEFAHWANEMHRRYAQIARERIAAGETSPEVKRIVDDWEALKKKVGAESDVFTDDQEEQVARMFEAFAREGKAPSEKLRSIFARYLGWLVDIYKSLRDLNVTLDDEVRGVFNRWIASEEEIAKVREKNSVVAEIAKAAGLPEDISQKVADYVNGSIGEAEETLYRKLDSEQKRRETKAYKDEFRKMRESVAGEFNNKREYQVVNYLKNGDLRLYIGPEAEVLGLTPEVDFPTEDAAPVTLEDLERLDSEIMDAAAAREYAINILLRKPPKAPRSLLQFITSRGGLRLVNENNDSSSLFPARTGTSRIDKAELEAIGITEKTKVAGRKVLREKGMELDYAREAAEGAGYLPEGSDVNDLLNALRDELGGNPVYLADAAETFWQMEAYAKAEEIANLYGINIERERIKRRKYGRYSELFTDESDNPMAVVPDVVAELFGYGTAKELISALRSLRDFDSAVDQEARSRLLGKFPDMIKSGRIHHDALSAVLNDRVVLALDLMIKELGKTHGTATRLGMKQFAKVIAQEQISKMKISQANYSFRYEVAREKELREALISSRKGNVQETMLHLQKAMVNQVLYKSLEEFRDFRAKAEKLFSRVDEKDKDLAPRADIDFIGAARFLLYKYGLGGAQFDINSWLADIQEREPDVLNDLVNVSELISAPQKTAGQLTIPEFIEIYNSIKSIYNTARFMREVEVEGKKVATANAVGEMVAVLSKMKQRPEIEGTQLIGKTKLRERIMGLKAMQRRVEHWVNSIQGGYDGPMRKYVWDTVASASAEYRDAHRIWMAELDNILKKHQKRLTEPGKIYAPELVKSVRGQKVPMRFHDRLELIGFMLHMGNSSNLDKLLGGYGIDPDSFKGAIRAMEADGRIKAEDYEIAQDLWNLAEGLKPISQRAHKKLYGYRFEEIESAPLQTSFGVYPGGYWPAVVDYDQVKQKLSDSQLDELKRFSLASTNKGFTKARNSAFRKPLSTDLRIASQHINQVLKFAYIEPAVRQVSRLINHKDFVAALESVDSEAKISMLDPWLRRSAWQSMTALNIDNSSYSRFFNSGLFRFLNKTVSRNTMIGNIPNAIQNYTGFSVAAHKIGWRNFGKAFAQFLAHPMQAAEQVRSLSTYMRGRQNLNDITLSQEIGNVITRRGYYKKLTNLADKYGYIFQHITQGQLDTITWIGSYNQALSDGRTEADAIKYADSVVRTTLSSMNPEDISAIEAGSEAAKLFIKFYSWFNNIANYAGTEASNIIKDYGWAGSPRLFYLYMMAIAVPAVLGDIVVKGMRGDLPDDDDNDGETLDDWIAYITGAQARYIAAGVPYAGQPINALINTQNDKPYDDRISAAPVFQQAESVVRFAGKNIRELRTGTGGYTDDSQAIRDGMTAIGFLTGIPLGQASKPISFAADVAEGDVRPSPAGYVRGVVAGPLPANRQ